MFGVLEQHEVLPGTTFEEIVMGLFRKKPVVVTAFQWFKNGDHPNDYDSPLPSFQNGRLSSVPAEHRREHNWEGEVVRYFRRPDVAGDSICSECMLPFNVHGWIDTLEDGHRVCPGDWIITGVAGERYPCKPGIFNATYEPVGE